MASAKAEVKQRPLPFSSTTRQPSTRKGLGEWKVVGSSQAHS